MARRPFGGGTTDLVAAAQFGYLAVTATIVKFWTARTGGSQIVDLLNTDGSPATFITCDSHGQVPPFQGPADGTDIMWADAGGQSRQAMYAVGGASIIDCGGAA